jgi:hypothetical protein
MKDLNITGYDDKRVIVTKPMVGITAMQVCCVKDATDEEILAVCNSENPSGTTNGWGVVIRNNEMGYANPVVCGADKERLHILIVC